MSSCSSHHTSNAAAGAAFLLLAAAGCAAWPVSEEGDGAAWCGPSKAKVEHALYVTGSTSGRGMRETVIGVPREVPLPGPPGRIDGVAFGPSWVAVAKEVGILFDSKVQSVVV